MQIFDYISKDKLINKGVGFKRKISILLIIMLASFSLCGCGDKYDMPYSLHNEVSVYDVGQMDEEAGTFPMFAEDLCVVSGNVNEADLNLENSQVGAVFDINDKTSLYAKNPLTQVHPASLTKIMTALVALKYAPTDQMLVASDNVVITEPGAQLCGLKPGDSMTLDQAIHILLIYSANDVAVLIAEGIAGSVDNFCDLMNEEALSIGATNSHFLNPNGLTEEGHFVTAYDMYLIFKEALKYSLFNEVIQMSTYETVYYDSNGNQKELSVESTNAYVKDGTTYNGPVTVIGGKTGTTAAAGHCLILYVRDANGNPYVSVIMNADSTENLYLYMNELLNYISS